MKLSENKTTKGAFTYYIFTEGVGSQLLVQNELIFNL